MTFNTSLTKAIEYEDALKEHDAAYRAIGDFLSSSPC
jgi:hypothetical protein